MYFRIIGTIRTIIHIYNMSFVLRPPMFKLWINGLKVQFSNMSCLQNTSLWETFRFFRGFDIRPNKPSGSVLPEVQDGETWELTVGHGHMVLQRHTTHENQWEHMRTQYRLVILGNKNQGSPCIFANIIPNTPARSLAPPGDLAPQPAEEGDDDWTRKQ